LDDAHVLAAVDANRGVGGRALQRRAGKSTVMLSPWITTPEIR